MDDDGFAGALWMKQDSRRQGAYELFTMLFYRHSRACMSDRRCGKMIASQEYGGYNFGFESVRNGNDGEAKVR